MVAKPCSYECYAVEVLLDNTHKSVDIKIDSKNKTLELGRKRY